MGVKNLLERLGQVTLEIAAAKLAKPQQKQKIEVRRKCKQDTSTEERILKTLKIGLKQLKQERALLIKELLEKRKAG